MALSEFLRKAGPLVGIIASLPLEQFISLARMAKTSPESTDAEDRSTQPTIAVGTQPTIASLTPAVQIEPKPLDMPTTEETITDCKRRLAKELYKLELDLVAGCKIAGKACDCCDSKHPFAIESMSEELIPMDPTNTLYRDILTWLEGTRAKITTEASASGKYDEEYPIMASQMREFRKRVMGTDRVGAVLTAEEKKKAVEVLGLEDIWQS